MSFSKYCSMSNGLILSFVRYSQKIANITYKIPSLFALISLIDNLVVAHNISGIQATMINTFNIFVATCASYCTETITI